MREPTRWLDEETQPTELKGLLRAEAGTELPVAVRERVGAKLGVALGITMASVSVTTKVASAAASGVGSGTAAGTGLELAAGAGAGAGGALTAGAGGISLKSILLGGVLTLGVGGGTVLAVSDSDVAVPVIKEAPSRAVSLPAAHDASPAAPSLRRAVAPSEPFQVSRALASAVPSAPTVDSGAAASSRPGARAPSVGLTRRVAEPANPRLEEEVSALRRASALLALNPEGALAELGKHTAKYPQSQLGVERDVLRLQALLRLDRRTEAQALGKGLLGNTGATLYHPRVKRLLARTPEPVKRSPR